MKIALAFLLFPLVSLALAIVMGWGYERLMFPKP